MPCGLFHSTYERDEKIFQTKWVKAWLGAFLIFLFAFPFLFDDYLIYNANIIGIFLIGALGLNILTGFTGQISLGHGAFMGVGAYVSGYISTTLGLTFWVALPIAGFFTAAVGMIFGIPSLRLRGLYLAIATLAAQFVIDFIIIHLRPITGGSQGLMVNAPSCFGYVFDTDRRFYFIVLILVIAGVCFARNLFRTKTGRAFIAIRDRYLSAEMMGINLFKYRIISFGISSFYVGIAGALWAHYLTIITPDHFTINISIQYLAMIIIGGLGSILGSIYGTIFMILLPEVLRALSEIVKDSLPYFTFIVEALREGVFGLVIIIFLIFEPDGLAERWRTIRSYWKLWPFSY
ncbi:MAG: branched-chain amino acid ABC transporter permease [Thermodesulfobacteriota bacterium]|nr:branched-chain amino acid ABC transporter permease [Thermodesulfobacteriota bacterium]